MCGCVRVREGEREREESWPVGMGESIKGLGCVSPQLLTVYCHCVMVGERRRARLTEASMAEVLIAQSVSVAAGVYLRRTARKSWASGCLPGSPCARPTSWP
jgi:hypothetical protein